MASCSFGGNWISADALILIGAAATALALAPVAVGMIIGWNVGRAHGRPWRRAFQGAAWVLVGYLAIAAIWFGQQYLPQQRAMQEARALQASIEPLYAVQPGGWRAALAGLDMARQAQVQQNVIAFEVANRLRSTHTWTEDDWLAIAQFADELRAESPGIAGEIDALSAFARHGPERFSIAQTECRNNVFCTQALESALASHDQTLAAAASNAQLTMRAKALEAATRAALERTLQRRRNAPYGGDSVSAELAFDRVARGGLAHALEACGIALPAPHVPSNQALLCLSSLLEGLGHHGVSRLCADAPLDAADQRSLDQLTALMATPGLPPFLLQAFAGTRQSIPENCAR